MMRCFVGKCVPWTEAEKEYVRQNYGRLKIRQIAEKLNRPDSSVCSVALRLGLERLRPHTRALWTEDEISLLRENFPCKSRRVVQQLLNRHTWPAINSQARKLKLLKLRKIVRQRFISEKLKNIPDVVAAYLAGIVDGEGHISLTLSKRKFNISPVLGIANSDRRIIKFIEEWLPVMIWQEEPENRGQRIISRRSCWRASVGGLLVGKILPKIIPYMTAKKRRAEQVVEFCRLANERTWAAGYNAEQIRLFLEVRKANSRRGRKWLESAEYRLLRKYLISRQAPGIS